jgi:hypothetical protein
VVSLLIAPKFEEAPIYPPPPLSLPAAPRWVPLRTRLALFVHDELAEAGVFVLSFSIILTCIFIHPVEMAAGPAVDAWGIPTHATVQRIENTRTTINGAPLYTVYATVPSSQGTRTIVAHTVRPPEETGAVLHARVVPTVPALSVIDGMDNPFADLQPLLFLICPVLGAALCLISVGRGMRWVRLLKRGVEAEGVLVAEDPRTFHFRDNAGDTWPVVSRSTRPKRLDAHTTARVLYLPYDPRRAVVVEDVDWLKWQQPRWSLPPGKVLMRSGVMLLSIAGASALGLFARSIMF